MGEALLMVGLPVPMATLPAPSAMVRVEPPLFCRGPRFIAAEVTLVAQRTDSSVIRLLAAVAPAIRFTVPGPEKSLPPVLPVLLAMILLAILRMPLPLEIPPP